MSPRSQSPSRSLLTERTAFSVGLAHHGTSLGQDTTRHDDLSSRHLTARPINLAKRRSELSWRYPNEACAAILLVPELAYDLEIENHKECTWVQAILTKVGIVHWEGYLLSSRMFYKVAVECYISVT